MPAPRGSHSMAWRYSMAARSKARISGGLRRGLRIVLRRLLRLAGAGKVDRQGFGVGLAPPFHGVGQTGMIPPDRVLRQTARRSSAGRGHGRSRSRLRPHASYG